ncbi:Flavin-nucleotide-binding protein structurally related to pyridoxine 5'-phosphate oxidase [uncultured Desulfobacterium sp.]|uniref:Flavin-nucleotide-binding protein structurally related to pyridoxine 5'-phosphate oxidase n=1 Tax=uncultured Desulfobacterium sp. TaxID=201089 RepID=A0A445N1W8_9BACT|nr:Flavin-nucleotide-binding protein structurally related to pyridoxine 5'-phosphate oxidase [uncultured Desulfobacterium sp.]
MAKMNKRMMEIFENVSTVAVATSTLDGIPNVVPVGKKKILDDETILISDQFFTKTLVNMKSNPRISIAFWEGREGYQLKGPLTIETSGKRFEETARWIDEFAAKTGLSLKCKGAVIIKIQEIYDVSPGPGAGERLG